MKWSKNEVNVAPDIVAFEKGVAAVLRIRCIEHRNVPQYNESESAGGECAACAVDALARLLNDALRAIPCHCWRCTPDGENCRYCVYCQLDARLSSLRLPRIPSPETSSQEGE